MKAYLYDDEWDDSSTIYWAETAGQAKRCAADENGIPFTEIRVHRVPWADQYNDMDEIPPEVYWAHGWWLSCEKCGKHVYEGEGCSTDKGVLCLNCLADIAENSKF